MRGVCACGSVTWCTLTDCFVCGNRCCTDCGEAYGFNQVVCSTCMSNASEVLERIRPEFYDLLLEMQEHYAGSIPEEPISLELYRLIVNCKSISEVVKLFEQNAVQPGAPDRQQSKRAVIWSQRRAA
jgi:hypothetical protein